MISIIGLEKGFFKIQVGRRFGYVNAKYVNTPQTEEELEFTPQSQSSSTSPSLSKSQLQNAPQIPIVEIFGGYSYLNFDPNELFSSRQSAHGWEASVSANLYQWFALEFDVSGYYKSYGVLDYSSYSYVAGPRFNFKPGYVHVLIGGDNLTASAFGLSASQSSFLSAFGGGVQFPIDNRYSFRIGADYVVSRHNLTGPQSFTQNNIRASAGIVINLGNRHLF